MKKIGRELNDAIENKKFDVARYILEIYVKRQYDINDTRDARYNQPLLARLLNDHYADLAKLAILAKADVNAKGCTGRSVLEMAAANGYKDIVELLISKGANVNSENEKDPPLSSAAKGGYKDIVDILLKTGADANAVNEYGHTPLMAAAMNNDIEIMDKLISFGADINAKDKMGRGAIFYAISNNSTNAIEYLKSRGAGSGKSQKLQVILTFSRDDMSDWDAHFLHDEILTKQNVLGYSKDIAVFKKVHVNAGSYVDDIPYMYAYIKANFLLEHEEVMRRCYFSDFRASDGNIGKIVLIFDKTLEK